MSKSQYRVTATRKTVTGASTVCATVESDQYVNAAVSAFLENGRVASITIERTWIVDNVGDRAFQELLRKD